MKQMMLAACSLAILMFSCKQAPQTGTYTVEKSSSVAWKGYLTAEQFNHGTFDVNSTDITTKDGLVTEGSFVIPIASLTVLNLDGPPKEQFLHHLQSEDFFNVVKYPDATFSITTVTPYTATGAATEIASANYMVKGNFNMLGVIKELSFPANISTEGNKLKVDAKFSINRLEYGMKYASDPKAELYIMPDVSLELHLTANKK